ncbi:MAG UNVERIFIED_CONTAM: DUF4162 domain-containing protein [Planctomycetaceae bacterium]
MAFAVSGGQQPPEDFRSGLPGVIAVRRESDQRAACRYEEPHVAIPALLELIKHSGLQLSSLTTRQATLEDVFVHFARPWTE